MTEWEKMILDALLNAQQLQGRYSEIIRDSIPLIKDYKRQVDYLERKNLELEGKNQRLQEQNRVMRDTIKSYGGKLVVPEEDRAPWYKRLLGHAVK